MHTSVFTDSTILILFRAALETIDRLTDSLDLTDYGSRIIHPLVRTLDTSSELRQTAMDTLSALVMQLGKKYQIFIPMVNKTLNKHKISHKRYDVLMCRIIKVTNLYLQQWMAQHVPGKRI